MIKRAKSARRTPEGKPGRWISLEDMFMWLVKRNPTLEIFSQGCSPDERHDSVATNCIFLVLFS